MIMLPSLYSTILLMKKDCKKWNNNPVTSQFWIIWFMEQYSFIYTCVYIHIEVYIYTHRELTLNKSLVTTQKLHRLLFSWLQVLKILLNLVKQVM